MLNIDLQGKIAFVVGVGDDKGYGWAIARALAEAGAKIIIGTWAPVYKIFMMGLEQGKFDASEFKIDKVYPIDASFDSMEDVPEDVRENKRYKELSNYTISDVVSAIERDYGKIDILVHSLANAPEVQKPLLETSRKGYLSAISSSSYSFVSLVAHCAPIMKQGGAVLSLSFIAAEKAIPGYGGGMSSAKAALESDTRTLAWEAGRKYGLRVNTISAGAASTRAAKAIGFIDEMIRYSHANAPLARSVQMEDVGNTAAFLCSPLAAAITGVTLYVDQGLHAMGVAVDSPSLNGVGSN